MEKLAPEDAEILRKIADDPRYLIERSFSIIDQSSQEVPFIFNPVQADYWDKREEKDIIVKSRKMGFSSVILAAFVAICGTRANTNAASVSYEEEATKRLLKRADFYAKTSKLPFRVKVTDNEIRFLDTNSVLYIGTAGSRSFGRGDDLFLLHLSESAHYADDKMITGVTEALIKGVKTWMIEESTAQGAGTPFHRRWLRAVRGESSVRPHFYGWHQDPLNVMNGVPPWALSDEERELVKVLKLRHEQLSWRRQKLADMPDPVLFPQEYPATWEEAFLASGSMLFDWKALKRCEDNRTPPKWKGNIVDAGSRVDIVADAKGPLEIYLTPREKAKYLIIADAAQGVPGGANCVADVFDMRSWEQVAQWRGHAAPREFGELLMRLGAFYGWALLGVENNYPGNAVLEHVSSSGYPNIYDEPGEDGDELGFKTTEKSKSLYIADGRQSVSDGSLKVNSLHTINEMRTFVLLENGKVGPQDGCLQDTVITACKAANVLKRMQVEPEGDEERRSFREIMNIKKRRGGGAAGGNYKGGVV